MNLSYSSLAAALAFFAAIVADPARAQDDIRVRIANSYGLPAWSQVEQLRYTFNVDRGKDRIKRSWLWDVKNNSVTFEGAGKDGQPVKRSYVRSDVKAGSPEIVETDRMFINDEYWLVFPFHLVWDSSAKIEDKGNQALPIGKGTAKHVMVTYPSSGGYTPGDMYELFIGPDNRVLQWAYHRGGPEKPATAFTWEDHQSVGPLTVSMNHHGATPGFRIWFSGVAAKLAGSDKWIAAK